MALEIDATRSGAEPLPVRRRVLLEAMRRTAGGREIGLDHVEAVLDDFGWQIAGASTFPAAAWNFGAESWS